ncbi:MAG TPA: glycoside hydrolase family 38 C-terminal domain-containing protein [Phycisphaerae bacterium]|nr:glycoside hydrolase family 38 C-terminal domain-containing protein [Phycisphaerae bacterium]
MNSWPIYPNFRFATTREYYEILEKNAADFPVVNDELNYEFTGCYTSQSDIKKVNRLSECLLERAEYSAVLADTVLGKKNYPYEELREAWRATLLGHFHDILPGSGVKATREYSSGQFQNTAATAGMIITNSLRAVAKEIDTSFAGVDEPSKDDVQFGAGMGLGGAHCGGISSACHVSGNKRGVVVFNPVACRRNEVISVTVWDAEHDDVHTEQFTACTADGLKIPAQRLNSGQLWGHRYVDIAVPVSVPAMSYSSLVLESVPDELPLPANAPGYSYLQKTDFVAGVRSLAAERPLAGYHVGTFGMENEFVRVVFDRASGGIVELVDRSTGINVVSPEKPAALLEYVMERPAGMSAWLIREAKKSICPLELTSFAPIQYGPHTAAYEGVYKVGNSTIKVRYSLSAGESQVRIAIQADWMECGGPQIGVPALRLRCPFAVNNAVGTYEIPFGSIKRKPQPAQEVPSQKFVDVTGKCLNGKIGGCAVFNDSKYGYCLDGSTLTCTLIRSSYEPDPLPEQGKFEMKFSLQPHGRELSVAELMHAGAAFNQPLQIVSTDIHVGHMPANGNEAISCMPDSVIITGVKKSEDEDAIIVRLLETQGKDTIAKVKLNHDIFGQFKTAEEIDLLERSLGNAVLKIMRDGYFSIKMSANSVASVKLKK